MLLGGQQETRSAAVAAAEKAIDRTKAPAVKKVRLDLPDASDHDPMAEREAARLDVTLALVSTAEMMVSLEAQAAQ
jgi:alpha-beta hydrolase superfamily lysophospholipase